MKISEMNIEEIIRESDNGFWKLKRAKFFYYVVNAAIFAAIFLCLIRDDNELVHPFFVTILIFVVLKYGIEPEIPLMHFWYSRMYKKEVLLPILQKIDGFKKYYFKSRDFRVKMLSHNLSDKNEDVMVFNRSNCVMYCSEFYSKISFSKKETYDTLLLLKFKMEKPLGFQLLFSDDGKLDNEGYYLVKSSSKCKCYSLFKNLSIDETQFKAFYNLFVSLKENFGYYLRLMIDNDVICIYVYTRENHFDLKVSVSDSVYEDRLISDIRLLKRIFDASDLIESFAEKDSSLLLPIPLEDRLIADMLIPEIKIITKRNSRFARVVIISLVIIVFVVSFVLALVLVVFAEKGDPIILWWSCMLSLFAIIGKLMTRLFNRLLPKKIFTSICNRFNKTVKSFKVKRRRNKKSKPTNEFQFFNFDYLKENSIMCKFDTYNLYLFSDDCFTGTLLEFEYYTKNWKDVEMIVTNSGIQNVGGATYIVIDDKIKKCIMSVMEFLRDFNPSLTLHVVEHRSLVQIYVPSSGYIDLSMDLFEAPDYELTAQNAVQISRMIRAADRFVETYRSN